ncbi:MAG: hypothetical protein II551_07895 [Paludibacteraceae bacterium]|nr:hypothetical protein [Paludibacteraceae bacterium]
MEYTLENYSAFELLSKAMIFVKEAAEAGGSVNLYKCPSSGFIDDIVEGGMYFENFLPVFGTLEEDPDPMPSDYKTDEEYEEAIRNHKLMFTLNENGWKLAEQIKHLNEAMKGIAPDQSQIKVWTQQHFMER